MAETIDAVSRALRPDREAGHRSRKRRLTYERIAQEGFNLFLRDGFEATTIDAIARAADISRRTFFYYFASKEDVLFSWERDSFSATIESVRRLRDGEPAIDAVEKVLIQVADRYQNDHIIAIDRLLRSTPALAARQQLHYDYYQRVLLQALAERWPERDPLARQIVAMAAIGVLHVGAEMWHAGGYVRPFRTYVIDGLRALRQELLTCAPAAEIVPRKPRPHAEKKGRTARSRGLAANGAVR